MANLLVSDLDGTLVQEAAPCLVMCRLYTDLAAAGWCIHYITSRQANLHQVTMQWLLRHCPIGEALLMRAEDDWDPAPIMKVAYIKPLLSKQAWGNVLAIDSRDDICAAYRGLGLRVLQCMPS